MEDKANTKPARDSKGRFLPGNSGGGRPPGTKNKLVHDFIKDFHTVWQERGMQALEAMATEKPAEFVRAGVQLMPKDVTLTDDNGTRWVLNATPALTTEDWQAKHGIAQSNQRVIEHTDQDGRKDN